MESQQRGRFNDASLKGSGLYPLFLLFLDSASFPVSSEAQLPWLGTWDILRRCFPPVLINPILYLDNGKIADLDG